MRITMISLGSTGDVRPYVMLGRELKQRGHEVTIAAFSTFENMVKEMGLRFFPIAGDVENLMSNIMKPGVVGGKFLMEFEKSIRNIAPVLLNDLLRACENAEALVCNFFGSMYYSVAEKYGIPCIQTQFFPMDPNHDVPISSAPGLKWGKAWNSTSYRIGYLLMSLLEKRYLTDWRKENGMTVYGLRTHPDYVLNGHTIPVLYAMSPQVLHRPKEWGENIHMTGFWWNETPCTWQPPEDLQRFMESGPTPIYIGFGSMNSGDISHTYAMVIRAIRAAKVRAVINLGWNSEKLHFKSNSRIYFGDYIPHDWLFSRVSAVVHHGGAGTMAAGLRNGKPTLIVPFGGDQPFWGLQVHAMGCGPKPVKRDSMTVGKLTRALIDLTTNDNYRIKAEEVGARMRQEHGVEEAANLIEQSIAAWRCEKEA